MTVLNAGNTVQVGPRIDDDPPTVQIDPKMTAHAYVRQEWKDEWVLAPYLQPMSAVELALPSRSKAEFIYHEGLIKREDLTAFTQSFRTKRMDWFVCIRVTPGGTTDPYVLWCGVIPVEQLAVFASSQDDSDPPDPQPRTNQVLQAYGFDYLLERRRIHGAWVMKADTSVKFIEHAPAFNEKPKQGLSIVGNMSDGEHVTGVQFQNIRMFDEDTSQDPGNQWDYKRILNYLFWATDHQRLVPIAQRAEPVFALTATPDVHDFLRSQIEVVEQEGRSVWAIATKLFDRKRGLNGAFTWSTDAQGFPTGRIELDISSLSGDPITYGDDAALPAAVFRATVTLDEGKDTQGATIQTDTLQMYDTIIVQGARVRTCFTANATTTDVGNGLNRARSEEAWTVDEQVSYILAEDAERAGEVLGRVWTHYRFPFDFDWLSTGFSPPSEFTITPFFDDLANVVYDAGFPAAAEHWNRQHLLLKRLPIEDRADANAAVKRYMKPFAIAEVLDEDGEPLGRYVMTHNPQDIEDGTEDLPSSTLTMSDRDMSYQVVPQQKGASAHIFGKNHITPGEAGEPDSKYKPVFDYRRMFVTLAVETDTRPFVKATLLHTDSLLVGRQLVIKVDDAHFWYVVPNTIVGLDSQGGMVYHSGFGEVRDDTGRLRNIAARAVAWYGKTRTAIQFQRTGLVDIYELGVFIDTVDNVDGQIEVNTAVSERRWNFTTNRTTIKTGHIELDVVAGK